MPKHNALEREVVAFLRVALAQRYDAANIRHYTGFDALSDEQIASLRDFGLRYIYPEWDARCFQLEAFDALQALLASPMRLKPLVAVTLKSLWRFGRQLPRAIEAGKEVIGAFEATRVLEGRIVYCLREVLPNDTTVPVSDDITQALRMLPREQFDVFVADMIALMRLLTQRDLLETGFSVLADIASAMEKRRECYELIEIEGARYALKVMDEGMALFDTLDDAAVAAAIEGIAQVEHDWFEQITLEEA